MIRWIALFAVSLVLIGCQAESRLSSGGEDTSAAPAPGAGAPPMMQVEPDPQEEEQLATLKQEYERSKETFESKKTDEAKKEYVEATVAYATATMMAGSLLPKEKYPAALRLYREALEVDPDNETASANKELIEGIYKNNLNRPIPE